MFTYFGNFLNTVWNFHFFFLQNYITLDILMIKNYFTFLFFKEGLVCNTRVL